MQGTADAGRGSASFSGDETSQLSGQVIEALRKASVPALLDCTLQWNEGPVKQLGQVYKAQSVRSYKIMSAQEFEQISVKFKCAKNPITGQPIDLEFNASAFTETDLPLFQLAANEHMKDANSQEVKRLSLKYQVLSKETAMVGVIKQNQKATGELITFTKETKAVPVQKESVNMVY